MSGDVGSADRDDRLLQGIRARHVVQDVDGQWYLHSANGGTWSAYHLRLAANLLDELNAVAPCPHHAAPSTCLNGECATCLDVPCRTCWPFGATP